MDEIPEIRFVFPNKYLHKRYGKKKTTQKKNIKDDDDDDDDRMIIIDCSNIHI